MDGQTQTHPRGYPLHWVIPMTLKDTLTLSDTHDTEGYPDTEWYPWHWGIPWHWVIPITPSDTHYGNTQEDTHHTEWYPLHWVIPIMDTPKRIPITLSDTHTLSDFSSHWQFSRPTQELTHYTEGPYFPHKQTGHRVIPLTLRDTSDTEWYPLPWVLLTNRIPDGRTHTNFFI
jgi:hypothetical protein